MATLTNKIIRAASARGRLYEITCSRTRGLILRVNPSGKKVFFVRVRSATSDNKIRLGPAEEVSLTEARAMAARLLSDFGSRAAFHSHPASPPIMAEARLVELPTESAVRFYELAAEFSTRHVETAALREATRKYYRKAVRDFVAIWSARSLRSIRFADVEEWHRKNAHRPSAANNAIRVLHTMYEKASQWDLWDGRNPARGIKLYRETKRKRYLRAEERVRLDVVLENALVRFERGVVRSKQPRARWSHVYAIRLLLLTGFRESEVLDLEWTWVDREHLQIVLPDSKTGQSVRVISPAVLELLDELEERRKPGVPWVVYGRNDQRINAGSLSHAWRRFRIAAGIEDVRIHDLRHSAASAAISAGCSLKEVGAILGHKNPATTARYAHLSDDAARAAAKRMTDEIAGAKRRAGRTTQRGSRGRRTKK